MKAYEVIQGEGPVILGQPHVGTYVPPEVWAELNDTGRRLTDTDWHIDRLYDGLLPGATVVKAVAHRYVIDANRAPSGASLYPGQNTTGLVPETDFDGNALWQRVPDAAAIEARRLAWHAPYHAALTAEVERVRAKHGVAILYDCHSIRSTIPFLFEGRLPDLNIGTFEGRSCDSRIEAVVATRAAAAEGYSHILNGRFKGGWTTRHYGRPTESVHAIQMELAQATHLASETEPFAYDPARAEPLRRILPALLHDLAALAPSLKVPS